MIISKTRLYEFIDRAVQATFVADGPFERVRGIKIRSYSEANLLFEDRYTGNLVDTGITFVWLEKSPIWAMSYRGGVLEDSENLAPEIFAFLREALARPAESLPARGPSSFIRAEFSYSNEVGGDFSSFSGHEQIRMGGRQVYWRWYCGGLVRDRRKPISLDIRQ